MRQTKQKTLIMQAVRMLPGHPTAEDVYASLKGDNPNLSLATVYRNLNLFSQQGKLLKIETPGAPARYDRNVHPHLHAKCSACGAVSDIDVQDLSGLMTQLYSEIERINGFVVDELDIVIEGTCATCRAPESADEEEPEPRSTSIMVAGL